MIWRSRRVACYGLLRPQDGSKIGAKTIAQGELLRPPGVPRERPKSATKGSQDATSRAIEGGGGIEYDP